MTWCGVTSIFVIYDADITISPIPLSKSVIDSHGLSRMAFTWGSKTEVSTLSPWSAALDDSDDFEAVRLFEREHDASPHLFKSLMSVSVEVSTGKRRGIRGLGLDLERVFVFQRLYDIGPRFSWRVVLSIVVGNPYTPQISLGLQSAQRLNHAYRSHHHLQDKCSVHQGTFLIENPRRMSHYTCLWRRTLRGYIWHGFVWTFLLVQTGLLGEIVDGPQGSLSLS